MAITGIPGNLCDQGVLEKDVLDMTDADLDKKRRFTAMQDRL
jgi:hypothetical protein